MVMTPQGVLCMLLVVGIVLFGGSVIEALPAVNKVLAGLIGAGIVFAMMFALPRTRKNGGNRG